MKVLSFEMPSDGIRAPGHVPKPRPPATRVIVRRKVGKKRGRTLKDASASAQSRAPKTTRKLSSVGRDADQTMQEEQGLLRRLEVARVKKLALRKRLKRISKQTRLERDASGEVACENAALQARNAAIAAGHCVLDMFSNGHVRRALTVLLKWNIIHDTAKSVVAEYITVACELILRTRIEAARQDVLAKERRQRFSFLLPNIEEKKARTERLAATRIQATIRQRQAIKVALVLEGTREENRQQQALENSMATLRHLVSSAKAEFDSMDERKNGIIYINDAYELGRRVLEHYTPNGHPLEEMACDAWLRRWDSCILGHLQQQKPEEGLYSRPGLCSHELQDILLFVCCTYEHHRKLEAAIAVQAISRKHRAVKHANKLRIARAQEESAKIIWSSAQKIQAYARRRQQMKKWNRVKLYIREETEKRMAAIRIQSHSRRVQGNTKSSAMRKARGEQQHYCKSAKIIQAGLRRAQAVHSMWLVRNAVVRLQSRARMHKVQGQQQRDHAAFVIQRSMQSHCLRMQICRQKAALAIQRYYFQYTCRQNSKQVASNKQVASGTIQQHARLFLSRKLEKKHDAAQRIVGALRRGTSVTKQRNAAERHAAVCVLQAALRSCIMWKKKQQAAATVMQKAAQAYLQLKRSKMGAASTIESAMQKYLARKQHKIDSATWIQAHVRSYLTRQGLKDAAATVMQKAAQAYLQLKRSKMGAASTIESAMQKYLARKQHTIDAARTIMRALRANVQWAYKKRAAARKIVLYMRQFKVAVRAEQQQAAITIQNAFRVHADTIKERGRAINTIRHHLRQFVRRRYAHRECAAVTIQTYFRVYRSKQDRAVAVILMQMKKHSSKIKRKKDMAAGKIASSLRLFVVRKKKILLSAHIILNRMRKHVSRMHTSRENAALVIQIVAQEYIKSIKELREAAALKISTIMRTYLVRLHLEKNVAALMLQATMRSYAIRGKQRLNLAAVQIQCCARKKRGYVHAAELRNFRESCMIRHKKQMMEFVAIRLQCFHRRHVATCCTQLKRTQRLVRAVAKIQRLARKFLTTRFRSASTIQAYFRQSRVQDIHVTRASAVLIQAHIRRCVAQNTSANQHMAAIKIQASSRKHMTANIEVLRSSSIRIQSHIRRCAGTKEAHILREAHQEKLRGQAVVKIQASIRKSQVSSMSSMRYSSTRIQSFRRAAVVPRVRILRKNAMVIQKAFRYFRLHAIVQATILIRRKQKAQKASVIIQAYFRRWKVTDIICYSSAALVIQSYGRRWLANIKAQRLRSERNTRASILLQSCVRLWLTPQFQVASAATIVLQSHCRRFLAARVAAGLQNARQDELFQAAMVASERSVGKDWRPLQKSVPSQIPEDKRAAFQFQFRKRSEDNVEATIQSNQDWDVHSFNIADQIERKSFRQSKPRRTFTNRHPIFESQVQTGSRRYTEAPPTSKMSESSKLTAKRRATMKDRRQKSSQARDEKVFAALVSEQEEEEREQKEQYAESKRAELRGLLEALNLERYMETFVEEGYDSISDIQVLGLKELTSDVEMKKGHARRLLHHFEDQLPATSASKQSSTTSDESSEPQKPSEETESNFDLPSTKAESQVHAEGGAIRVIRADSSVYASENEVAQTIVCASDIAPRDSYVRNVAEEISQLLKFEEEAAYEVAYYISEAAAVAWTAYDFAEAAVEAAMNDLKSAQYHHFMQRAEMTQAANGAKSTVKRVAKAVSRYCSTDLQQALDVVTITVNQLTAHQPKRKERHQLSREERRLQRRRRQKQQADAAVKIQCIHRGAIVRKQLPQRAVMTVLKARNVPKPNAAVAQKAPLRPNPSPRKRRMQDRHRVLRRQSLLMQDQEIPLVSEPRPSPTSSDNGLEEKATYRENEMLSALSTDLSDQAAQQKHPAPTPAKKAGTMSTHARQQAPREAAATRSYNLHQHSELQEVEIIDSSRPGAPSLKTAAKMVVAANRMGQSPRKQRQRTQIHDHQRKERAASAIQKHVRRFQTVSRLNQDQHQASLSVAFRMLSAVRTLQARFRAKQTMLDVKQMVMDSSVVVAMPGTKQGRSGWYNMHGMIVQLQIKGGSNWTIRRGPCSQEEWEKIIQK